MNLASLFKDSYSIPIRLDGNYNRHVIDSQLKIVRQNTFGSFNQVKGMRVLEKGPHNVFSSGFAVIVFR